MEINWTLMTYLVVGLFALSGFLKGWWKEAIVTLFLALFVFFLRVPGVAQALIDLINRILAIIWGILPSSVQVFLTDFFQNALGISTTGGTIQADATSGQTWLILLIILVGVATLIGWATLPNRISAKPLSYAYLTTPVGSVLGGLIGGLNGLIVINLVKEYLDGRNLPGGGSSLPSELTMAGNASVGVASSGVSLQATQLPSFTILDSFLPWIVIFLGILVFMSAMKNRVLIQKDKDGYRKVIYKAPFGYKKYEITSKEGK